MLSALSVLALLLAAGETQDPKPASVEVTALAVDLVFLCPTSATQGLVLTPKAQAQVTVPATCPDAGAPWRVTLNCPEQKPCAGVIRADQGAIALVQGPREKLQVKPLAREHPATLDLVALDITGQYTLSEPATEHQRPLQLLLEHPIVTGVYTLSPSEPLTVVYELHGKRLELQAEVTWTDDTHARLRLKDSRPAPLFDETLALKETRPLDCPRLGGGFCEGSLRLWLREYEALPLAPPSGAARPATSPR